MISSRFLASVTRQMGWLLTDNGKSAERANLRETNDVKMPSRQLGLKQF